MKKYLIIGGAGFIGSHLSEALSKKGHSVVVIDDFSTSASLENNPKIKIYKTDIENLDEAKNIFNKEKPDFVYHLAGAINLRRPISDPLFVKSLDILGRTKMILDVCKENNVQKIIFVSSGGAVYENAKIVPTPESYPAHPTSLYGLANLTIEKYIELYCKNCNLGFMIPRLSNVYGPRQWKSGVVPAMVLKILNKERPIIYGAGNQTRDFIYIEDVVNALIILAEKGGNGIYNVGSAEEISLNEIFELIKNVIGVEISPIHEDSRSAETERSALDINKITKELGWQPKINIKDGLKETIQYYGKPQN